MKIERREFLGSTVVGMGTALASGRISSAAPADVDPTAVVPLGRILKVTRIGAGTGMRGGMRQTNQTRLGREKFEALLRYTYDEGIRMFDVADLYGTQPYVGRALKDKPRDSYVLVSKVWWRPGGLPEKERPDADVCIKRFLKELQTDYIDLVQLHCVTSPKWPQELRKQMDIMAELKRKGIIRSHGVSCHSVGALTAAAEEPWVDVVHARINPYGVKMDDKSPRKVVPVLEKIHAARKGVIGMKLIGEGQFRDDDQKREESVRWVMGLGCVDTMVVGFEKPEEIDDFKARVRRTLLARTSG